MSLDKIRNFSILAHIDHGKSTLADRILLLTGAVPQRVFRDQFLDSNEIERERGITIKAKAVAIRHRDLLLNLIDTPGHADFTYEVSKSMAACEGALLVVDATQGIQAQTVANLNLALDAGLTVLPVINKIDLPHARVDACREEIAGLLSIPEEEILAISAKHGTGVEAVLEAIVERIPPPEGDPGARLQALIFDAVYDEYRGVVIFVRLRNGSVRKGDRVEFVAAGRTYEVEQVGVFTPELRPTDRLEAGEVGYIIAGVKSLRDVRIGDTVRLANAPETPVLPGYRQPRPMVFCEFYPAGKTEIDELDRAIQKLSLNDAAFTFRRHVSDALGPGFHCGFLGLLHMEIVQERLEREGGVELIKTAPQTTYQVVVKGKGGREEVRTIETASRAPDPSSLVEWREPFVRLKVVVTPEFIGNVMKLVEARRGEFVQQRYLGTKRVLLEYDIPFAEIVYDFYDTLKSVSRGFASMDYAFIDYFPGDLVCLRILVAGKEVDALTMIVHRDSAYRVGRRVLQILRREIPRQAFQVALQAMVGGKVIARENIAPVRKDVIAKCYGGDYTRKRKLLEKQKEGKRRMKLVGTVQIPQEAFMAVLKVNEE